jgi:hypothetical protein
MQINVHNFTLTTGTTATITVQADSKVIAGLPKTVINTLATEEALDLTGFEWQAATAAYEEATAPNGEPLYTFNVKLNRY